MGEILDTDEMETMRVELDEIGRSIRSSFRLHAPSFRVQESTNNGDSENENEPYASEWAAIERLPTYKRLKSSLFDVESSGDEAKDGRGKRVIDVTKLGAGQRHLFIEKLIKHIEHDNLELLRKIRRRIDKVGVKLPSMEVRYKNLCVEAECEVVDGKPLPTLWNSAKSILSVLGRLWGSSSREAKISIINDVSGIIKPGRYVVVCVEA